jgi:hypothetical protein
VASPEGMKDKNRSNISTRRHGLVWYYFGRVRFRRLGFQDRKRAKVAPAGHRDLHGGFGHTSAHVATCMYLNRVIMYPSSLHMGSINGKLVIYKKSGPRNSKEAVMYIPR